MFYMIISLLQQAGDNDAFTLTVIFGLTLFLVILLVALLLGIRANERRQARNRARSQQHIKENGQRDEHD